mgnify:CR=1 FL=1
MSKKKWTNEKIEWLKQNYENKSISNYDIVKYLNIDWITITKKASLLNLKRKFRENSKLFNFNTTICDDYKTGKSIPKLAIEYNCSKDSIRQILIKNNINRRSALENKRQFSYDKNYFEKIDSKDKAYFLGLLYADGNVFAKTGSVQLSLQEKDGYILERFKEYINYEGNLKYKNIKANKKNSQNMWLFRITSIELCKQLIKLGCVPRKSLILTFPTEEQVPKEFQSHFIRGFFDGDGCIYISNKSISSSFTSTKEFLQEVQKILIKEVSLNLTKLTRKKANKNTYSFNISGFYPLKRLYEYLYKDCDDLYLERKKEKIHEFTPQRKERKTSEKYKMSLIV